jgi:hypothetical protein
MLNPEDYTFESTRIVTSHIISSTCDAAGDVVCVSLVVRAEKRTFKHIRPGKLIFDVLMAITNLLSQHHCKKIVTNCLAQKKTRFRSAVRRSLN